MKCFKCRREMTADEPVYRLFIDVRFRYRNICAPCEVANAAAKARRKFRPWLPPRPCDHCARPVIWDKPPREGERYFACGRQCRAAIHNANFRQRHPREKVDRRCVSCGETFSHKRSNAKFCSARCKQKAQ